MFKVIIFLIAGIVFARFYYPIDHTFIIGLILFIILLIALSYAANKLRAPLRSMALLTSIALCGSINYSYHADKVLPTTSDMPMTANSECILMVEDYPKKANSVRAKVKILSIDTIILDNPIYGEVYSNNQALLLSKPKDTLLLKAFVQRISPDDGDTDFDYGQFLLDQGISYQLWSKNSILTLPAKKYAGLDIIKYKWRSAALEKLKTHLSSVNFGLAASLILGYRNELDPEIRDQFADTGAIHILAVSGMHVGIIIFFLNFILFQKLDKRLKARTLWKGLLLTVLLLLYVLITGAALPVIRAAVLFIILYFAFFLQRDYSSLNVLAMMAVLLLMWNPFDLFNISFQLSFGAVSSIIVFYPMISKSIYVPNSFLRFFWSIIAMSIAAQILIFPLTILYFHQFPIYFIISSVVAIVMATLILPTGFLLLLIPFAPISNYLGDLLEYLCNMLNSAISSISRWPNAIIENINLDTLQFILVYAALISLAFFIYSLKVKWIHLSLISMIIFMSYGIFTVIDCRNQAFLHDYQDQGLIDIIIGNKAYQLNTLQLEQNVINRISSRFRRAHQVQTIQDVALDDICELIDMDYYEL